MPCPRCPNQRYGILNTPLCRLAAALEPRMEPVAHASRLKLYAALGYAIRHPAVTAEEWLASINKDPFRMVAEYMYRYNRVSLNQEGLAYIMSTREWAEGAFVTGEGGTGGDEAARYYLGIGNYGHGDRRLNDGHGCNDNARYDPLPVTVNGVRVYQNHADQRYQEEQQDAYELQQEEEQEQREEEEQEEEEEGEEEDNEEEEEEGSTSTYTSHAPEYGKDPCKLRAHARFKPHLTKSKCIADFEDAQPGKLEKIELINARLRHEARHAAARKAAIGRLPVPPPAPVPPQPVARRLFGDKEAQELSAEAKKRKIELWASRVSSGAPAATAAAAAKGTATAAEPSAKQTPAHDVAGKSFEQVLARDSGLKRKRAEEEHKEKEKEARDAPPKLRRVEKPVVDANPTHSHGASNARPGRGNPPPEPVVTRAASRKARGAK